MVAIDELTGWDRRTMPKVIRDLERQALVQGGHLILVLRDVKDFMRGGYALTRPPAHVHVHLTSYRYSPADLDRLPTLKAQNA